MSDNGKSETKRRGEEERGMELRMEMGMKMRVAPSWVRSSYISPSAIAGSSSTFHRNLQQLVCARITTASLLQASSKVPERSRRPSEQQGSQVSLLDSESLLDSPAGIGVLRALPDAVRKIPSRWDFCRSNSKTSEFA